MTPPAPEVLQPGRAYQRGGPAVARLVRECTKVPCGAPSGSQLLSCTQERVTLSTISPSRTKA
jgi:hypothetical protein